MRNTISSINVFNKETLTMKYFIRSITVCSGLFLLSGCAGMMVDSMGKSWATDKTYNEMVSTLPVMAGGKGRVYIYRTESSTKSSLRYGYGIAKNPTFCTVGNTAYELIWEAFKYIEFPEGQYEVSCGNDIRKRDGIFSHKFQKGENFIVLAISSGSEVFIRADAIKEKPFFQPILVKPEQAHEEMLNLPYQNRVFAMPGGKLADSGSE
jgi:hypothetical protein